MDKFIQECEAHIFRVTCQKDSLLSADRKFNNRLLDIERSALENTKKEFEKLFKKVCAEGDEKQREKIFSIYKSFYDLCMDVNMSIESFYQVKTEPDMSTTISKFSEMKLPKLELKSFHGGYTEWVEFIDIFQCSIHDRSDLADVQKLQYLKSCVKDEASMLIKSLSLTNSNYHVALDLLKNRYENKKNIIDAHLDALFAISVLNTQSSVALRKLVHIVTEHTNGLSNLGEPVSSWDTILVYMIRKRLDSETRLAWERDSSKDETSLKEMLDFLTSYACAIECAFDKSKRFQTKIHYTSVTNPTNANFKCYVCASENHKIYQCNLFHALSPRERKAKVIQLGLCLNCLSSQHFVSRCGKSKCRKCNKLHHTLLHFDDICDKDINSSQNNDICADHEVNNEVLDSQVFYSNSLSQPSSYKNVYLATAQILVRSHSGDFIACRALVDQGSQSSFISSSLLQKLRLSSCDVNVDINGVGGLFGVNCYKSVYMSVMSLYSTSIDNCIDVEALVIPTVTSYEPNESAHFEWNTLSSLELADSRFMKAGPIDVLLGADVFPKLLSDETRLLKCDSNGMCAMETIFGWIVMGATDSTSPENPQTCNLIITQPYQEDNLDDLIKRFWQIEELMPVTHWSLEEKLCEEHFIASTVQNKDGRYSVKLPFKSGYNLGMSRHIAKKRFFSNENRLKAKDLLPSYNETMQEYFRNDYAEVIDVTENINLLNCYYLPHHGVFKEDSSSTKLRIVFDASCKTASGYSLNDCLMVGPKIQQDLFDILVRFRKNPVAFIADIAKMYCQVKLQEEDKDYHRFLWRPVDDGPIKDCRMTVVTFGVSSSSFLAQRVLKCIADNNVNDNPVVSKVLLEDVYMDDCLSGAKNVEKALEIKQQLLEICGSSGFHFRKWYSNNTIFMETIPESEREKVVTIDDSDLIKTLGMRWCPHDDYFTFYVKSMECNLDLITKRILLSDSSKLFDPLGLLSPIMMTVKHIFQQLWLLQLDWDTPLPKNIVEYWAKWREDLENVKQIRVPRFVFSTAAYEHLQYHGFCDASERGYSACVYARSVSIEGIIQVFLVCSKNKVSPLKRLSIPRLELCGALLLAKLITRLSKCLDISNIEMFCWSDSTCSLDWIHGESSRWKTFVANRVSFIQELTDPSCWHYCPTDSNPADVSSRGTYASELIHDELWWNGPKWLYHNSNYWPERPSSHNSNCNVDLEIEAKKNVLNVHFTKILEIPIDITKYSDFMSLVRITAWCFRIFFINRGVVNDRRLILKVFEIENAKTYWIKHVQAVSFSDEIRRLSNDKHVLDKSKMRSLSPFIDVHGVIRVGGRISASNIRFESKHPIVLPKKHIFVELIIRYYHIKYLHASLNELLCILSGMYWIIGARDIVKQFIFNCVHCRKLNAPRLCQKMGELPASRVVPSSVFYHCGIDYAGPIELKVKFKRSSHMLKAWIALFICFAVKAVHVELVTNLSTDAFIATLKRFIARRGKPGVFYSDHGTNFVGTARELSELQKFFISDENNNKISNFLANDNIEWKFTPERGSHFGGLWESNIKSVKHHLTTVLGQAKLTYEEMSTFLCEVEACLNSRPLVPFSLDANDGDILTPGHFLVGKLLTALPELDHTEIPINRLDRWQYVTSLQQHWWKRWMSEYVRTLQNRKKWLKPSDNLMLGDIVIIKEDNFKVRHWPLGRVIELFPGSDGLCRVVKIKTASGIVTRPVVKLALIFRENNI